MGLVAVPPSLPSSLKATAVEKSYGGQGERQSGSGVKVPSEGLQKRKYLFSLAWWNKVCCNKLS